MERPFPQKFPLSMGDLDPNLIHGSPGPLSPQPKRHLKCQSVQPFLQCSLVWQTDRVTDRLTDRPRYRTPKHISELSTALENYSWAGLLKAIQFSTIDVSTAFDEFNRIITYFLNAYIPQHTVCIKPKDPSFITPLIKYLLRKRNLAMRRQQLDKASALSKKINQLIANQRKTVEQSNQFKYQTLMVND